MAVLAAGFPNFPSRKRKLRISLSFLGHASHPSLGTCVHGGRLLNMTTSLINLATISSLSVYNEFKYFWDCYYGHEGKP